MISKFLAETHVIGAAIIESKDHGHLLMYSSNDGKHFLKSYDLFRTIAESWVVPLGSITANANLIRLKDGRLMTIVRQISSDPAIAENKGADFYTAFSEDDGYHFELGNKINEKSGCYYLMNQRLCRTHTGRILLPVAYVPEEYLIKEEFFEKSGFAGCFFSDDEGETWSEGSFLVPKNADQLSEPCVAQGEDELVHLYARTGYGYLYRSISHDNGETWEEEVPSSLRSPCAPFTITFDSHSKQFFAVWDNSFPGLVHQYPRSPICLAKSSDCIHWEMVCELDQDPMKGYGYPAVYFTEKEVLVTYYESYSRKFSRPEQNLKMRLFEREELGL